ncbi:MAG TPA: DUF2064 domain-containing protein [Solirubrobacteraceae bacterium]|nr:DUF2064 domain-containing protein [Solirubrobacteraceae bacterium]
MDARVLLVARDPEGEPLRPELADLLGRERYVRLEEILLRRAAAWAAEVARGAVWVRCEPGGGEEAVRRIVGGGLRVLGPGEPGAARRLQDGVDAVFREGPGPLLVAWPELLRWRTDHATGALGDLAGGCDISVGPVFDGGFYLLALARPVPFLGTGPEDGLRSPESMARMLAAVNAAGLEAGLLRAERGLRREADLRAALADPLLDGELRAVLDSAR